MNGEKLEEIRADIAEEAAGWEKELLREVDRLNAKVSTLLRELPPWPPTNS